MTYYKKKRMQKGMSKSDIANALGIDYERYNLIEKGLVKMPKNLIDKFNEIINRGEINKIEKLSREQLVDQWWEEMKTKDENGKFNLCKKMKEFNISTFKELTKLLGYKDSSIISVYLNNRQEMGFDTKNRFYSFFENELNIQPPKTIKVKNKKEIKVEDKELLEWYRQFNFKEWKEKNNTKYQDLYREIGICAGTFSNLINKKFDVPSIKTLLKVKQYIENTTTEETPIIEETPIVEEKMPEVVKIEQTLEERLVNKYNAKVKDLNDEILIIYNQMEALNTKLADILEKKAVYNELIEDIRNV